MILAQGNPATKARRELDRLLRASIAARKQLGKLGVIPRKTGANSAMPAGAR
jgi:hypothetical protein